MSERFGGQVNGFFAPDFASPHLEPFSKRHYRSVIEDDSDVMAPLLRSFHSNVGFKPRPLVVHRPLVAIDARSTQTFDSSRLYVICPRYTFAYDAHHRWQVIGNVRTNGVFVFRFFVV